MPHYIIERNVGQLTPDQLQAAGRTSNQVLADMPEVVWVKSYVSDAEGKIYCEYIAPNPEAVLEHARRSGIPAHRISEVSLQINPAMFV
jgi:F420-0:gamma-glutamyl ligase